MDPFLSVISLLRPQATLWHQTRATGRWALSFRQRDDVLFCSVLRGSCQLLRPGQAAVRLSTGDFVLVRTCLPFRYASDAKVKAVHSEHVFPKNSSGTSLRLGSGRSRPVVLRGGRFLFDTANEDLLISLLPPLVHLSATGPLAGRVQALLQMNLAEEHEPGLGSDFVVARLIELLLVHVFRSSPAAPRGQGNGLLAGLDDPVTATALRCIHGDAAYGWTVAKLAKKAGVSRSGLASRFRQVVGTGPIDYLLRWRLALAKDQLRQDTQTISEIAFAVGFQSASAFSTAFRRATGVAPTRYAASTRAT